MRNSAMLAGTSLFSVLLFSVHMTGDVVRGIEPGDLSNLLAIPIMVVWLCGVLLLAERRSGRIIMLFGALLSVAVPVLHMRGAGVGGAFAQSSGAFGFIWTLFALGVCGAFAAVLAVLELFSRRVAGRRSATE